MLRRVMMAGAVAPAPTGFSALVLSHAPWGYWKLDSSASDSSGNGRDGTSFASMTYGQAPLFAGMGLSAVASSASGGRVDLPALPGPGVPEGQRKLTMLVSFSVVGGPLMSLLSSDRPDNRRWQLRVAETGAVEAISLTSSSTATTISSGVGYRDGQPHIAVLVFDDSLPALDGQMKLYLDGALAAASTSPAPYTYDGGAAYPAIGTRSAGFYSEPFTGGLDDCAIFRKALSASDVAALWDARNTP